MGGPPQRTIWQFYIIAPLSRGARRRKRGLAVPFFIYSAVFPQPLQNLRDRQLHGLRDILPPRQNRLVCIQSDFLDLKRRLRNAQREYAEDISLVLIYGSYVNGTANSRSDVDCCFIPKTERGYEMATGFILEGVGYDVFSMSWERVERIACLRENLTPLVGDVEIIFCGSAEDMARFRGMQEKLQCCLADGAYVRKIAEERCREAGRLCGMLEHVRTETEAWKLAGMVIMTLADAVAVFQHGYFHFGLKQQFEDLMKLREVPEGDRGDRKSVV